MALHGLFGRRRGHSLIHHPLAKDFVMAQPTPYERDYDFQGYQSGHPSTPLPGNKVNEEFDAIAAVVDEVLSRIADLQRDDLELANESVGYDQLKDELRHGFSTPTVWATATAYEIGDQIYSGRKVYAALIAHTSGTFNVDLAGGNWYLLADFTAVTAVDAAAEASAAAAAASAAAALASQTAAALSAADAALQATTAGTAVTDAQAARDAALAAQTAAENAAASAATAVADAIGVSVQAYSANLDSWSALAPSAKQDASANLTTLAASAADGRGYLDTAPYVVTRAAMKALDTAKDPVVDLTEGVPSTNGRFGRFDWDGSDLSATLLGADIASSAVDAGTDTITSVTHGLMTGYAVVTTTAVNGLALNTIYYVIRVDADNFKLASSFANAFAGTAFDLTGTTAVTVKIHTDPEEGVFVCPTADISGASGAYRRRLAGPTTPFMFGAANDNLAADSHPAFQAAVNFHEALQKIAATHRGQIDIPSSRYRLLNTVRVSRNNIFFNGASSGSVYIQNFTTNLTAFHFESPDTATAVFIDDVGIVGCQIQYAGIDPTSAVRGVRAVRCRRFKCNDNYIVNHHIGVEIAGCSNAWVQNNHITGGSNLTLDITGTCGIRLTRALATSGTGNAHQDPVDSLYYFHTNNAWVESNQIQSGATTFRLQYGVDARCFDGLFLNNNHIGQNGVAEVRFLQVQSNLPMVGLSAVGNYIDPEPGFAGYGIYYQAGGITGANINLHNWTGGLISSGDLAAIFINTVDARQITVDGLQITATAGPAVDILNHGGDIKLLNLHVVHTDDPFAVLIRGAGGDIDIHDCSFTGGFNDTHAISVTAGFTGGGVVDIQGCTAKGATSGLLTFSCAADHIRCENNRSDLTRNKAAGASVALPAEHDYIVFTTNAATVTTLTGGWDGRRVTIRFAVAALTMDDAAGNMDLAGDLVTTGTNDIMHLIYDHSASTWYETGRSAN